MINEDDGDDHYNKIMMIVMIYFLFHLSETCRSQLSEAYWREDSLSKAKSHLSADHFCKARSH